MLIDGRPVDRRARLDRAGVVNGTRVAGANTRVSCRADRDLRGGRRWRRRGHLPRHRRCRSGGRRGVRPPARPPSDRPLGVVCRPPRRSARRVAPCGAGRRLRQRRRSSSSPAASPAGPRSSGDPGEDGDPGQRDARSLGAVDRCQPSPSAWPARRPRRSRWRRQRCGPDATTRGGSRCNGRRDSRRSFVAAPIEPPASQPAHPLRSAGGLLAGILSVVGGVALAFVLRPPDVPHLQRHRVRHGARFGARHTARRSPAASPADRRVGPRRAAIRRRRRRPAERQRRLPARHGADDRRRARRRAWSVE